MRTFLVAFVILACLLTMGMVISAQEVSSNYCLDGTWFCADPDNLAREQWNYACGWYLGRYYAGEADEVPEWCLPEDVVLLEVYTAGCYDLGGSYNDHRYFGPLNQWNNMSLHMSTDGSCTGVYRGGGMWVETDLTTNAEVIAYCNTIGSGFSWAFRLVDAGINLAPANPSVVSGNIWVCGWDSP